MVKRKVESGEIGSTDLGRGGQITILKQGDQSQPH